MRRSSGDWLGGLLRVPHDGHRAELLVRLLRLNWFIRLRWLFVAAAVVALMTERLVAPHARRPAALWAVLALVAATNLFWQIVSPGVRRRRRRLHAASVAAMQIFCDLALLTAIVRYTGGAESPLAALYVYHMVIGALLLAPQQALFAAGWATALYGVLLWGDSAGWIVGHYPFDGGAVVIVGSAGFARKFLVVALAIFGVLYFTMQIAVRLEEREQRLRRVNAALENSRRAVADLQRRRADFLRHAAHQLKHPLAGVQTLVGVMRDGLVPPGEVANVLTRIEQRCIDGLEQVGKLLTLARMQDGLPDAMVARATAVAPHFSRVVAAHTARAEHKGVTLAVEREPGGESVRLSPQALEDCLSNLLDNAVKYTPAGGHVAVRATPVDECLQVEIRDTGIGIDAASQERLFEPYRRGQTAIAAGISGSGLGLSIVRALVCDAGGTVELTSEEGKGTVVVMRLPIEPVGESSAGVVGNPHPGVVEA